MINKICSIEGCNKKTTNYRTLCGMHRKRYQKYKSFELPIKEPRKSKSSSDRMKINNPMFNPIYKQKAIESLRRIGHKPPTQGGNGRGLTVPQKILYESLGAGWDSEYIVNTNLKSKDGYPPHYKIDIANPIMKIAIEIDGPSHFSLKQQERDLKKTKLLNKFGWKVIRFQNKQVLNDLNHVLKIINETT